VPLRLVFMGTPDFAVPTLQKLVDSGHKVVAAYTRAPQPAGRRGLKLTLSPVAREAERLLIPIHFPKTLKDSFVVEGMRAYRADAAIVVAYGRILPKTILDAFPRGCLNVHASLLPKWRGAAPIHRAVMAGDDQTGVTIMRMDEGLDTGPIAYQRCVPIHPDATFGDIDRELALVGASAMVEALDRLENGVLTFTPQPDEDVEYADKIEKSEARIDWNKPCEEVHNLCRGLSPSPGAWFEIAGVGRVKVFRTAIEFGAGLPGQVLNSAPTVACGHGAIRLFELQREGGKRMPAEIFWRSFSKNPPSVVS
jgi:methionyl-tRNA formyltransferase